MAQRLGYSVFYLLAALASLNRLSEVYRIFLQAWNGLVNLLKSSAHFPQKSHLERNSGQLARLLPKMDKVLFSVVRNV